MIIHLIWVYFSRMLPVIFVVGKGFFCHKV